MASSEFQSLAEDKHKPLIQKWVQASENSKYHFNLVIDTLRNVFPSSDKLTIESANIKRFILSGLSSEDLILYDEELGERISKKDTPDIIKKKKRQKALISKVDSYYKKIKLALFPPNSRDELANSLKKIYNLDRESDNLKRLFDGNENEKDNDLPKEKKRPKICADPDDVVVVELEKKYEMFYPSHLLKQVVRDFWLMDNRPTIIKKSELNDDEMLSKDAKYLFNAITKLPTRRLKPHKGFLAPNGDIVVGDMSRYNLDIEIENDRNEYGRQCDEWDMLYEMTRRDMPNTSEGQIEYLRLKELNQLPPVSYRYLDHYTQNFLNETLKIDDLTISDEQKIDEKEIKPKKNPLGRGVDKESKQDYYITPDWCIQALLNHPKMAVEFEKFQVIYDPCCGENKVFEKFMKKYYPQCEVTSRDKFNNVGTNSYDFTISNERLTPTEFDLIITNPPFSLKYQFLQICFKLGKPFCLLLPLQTLMTPQRIVLFKTYKVDIFILSPTPDFPKGNGKGKPLRTREVGFFYWNGDKTDRHQCSPDFQMFYIMKRELAMETQTIMTQQQDKSINGETSSDISELFDNIEEEDLNDTDDDEENDDESDSGGEELDSGLSSITD